MEEYYLEAEMRGRRSTMEDSHTHHFGPKNLEATEPCLFGVFDGHGGDECARFLAQNLCPAISEHPLFFDDPVRALEEAFVLIDKQYCHIAKQLDLEDGSTATVLLLQVDEKTGGLRFYVAGAGDSRAIIIKKDGSARCLVEDHNPTREDERQRIKRDGGEVLYDEDNDIYRVASAEGGGLAVTRAFGDFHFKPFVTARPEIVRGDIEDDDAFICIASDGLWNDLSNDEVGKAIVQMGARKGVEYVIQEAFERGSDDNITVVVVDVQIAMVRLKDEAAKRPRGSLKRSSTKTSSRRLSPSNRMNSADEGAGPLNANGFASPSGGEDPLLLAVARKISSVAVPPKLRLTTDVDDVEIPGIPAKFTNDLVLWRDPVLSFLWFFVINLMFGLSIFFEFSLVTIISSALLLRFITTFMVARVANLLKRLGLLGAEFETERFITTNHVVSGDTIKYFSNLVIGTIAPVVNKWTDLVIRGSTTNVLITLRTLTYLYTPVPIGVLSWITFLLVFTVPATYARHKDKIDEAVKDATNKITIAAKPHLDKVKGQLDAFQQLKVKYFGSRGGNNGDLGGGPPRGNVQEKLGIGHTLSEEL